MSYEHIEVVVDGAVGELKLNRPTARNAMSPEMGLEVRRAVAAFNDDDALRAVIITGEGKSFSSGGDFKLLGERASSLPDVNRRAMRDFYERFLSIRHLRVPSIAAINGHAIGAGLCFALGCDIRLAAEGCKLGVTFVKVGLHPGMGATHLLADAVGRAKAAELLLTGRVIDATEAARIGLVSEVAPRDELMARARAIAAEIARAAPLAVAQTKATLQSTRSLPETLDRESLCQALNYASKDLHEAVRAFSAKETPTFEGR